MSDKGYKIKRFSLKLLNEPIFEPQPVISINWPDEVEIKGPINLEPEKTYEFHGTIDEFFDLLDKHLLKPKVEA